MRSASSPEADDGPAFRDGPPSFELKAAPGEEAALRRSEDRIVRAQERRIMRTPLAVVLAVHRDEGWADYDWRIDLLHGEADETEPREHHQPITERPPECLGGDLTLGGPRCGRQSPIEAKCLPAQHRVQGPASQEARTDRNANCCLGGPDRRVLEGYARRRSREA